MCVAAMLAVFISTHTHMAHITFHLASLVSDSFFAQAKNEPP